MLPLDVGQIVVFAAFFLCPVMLPVPLVASLFCLLLMFACYCHAYWCGYIEQNHEGVNIGFRECREGVEVLLKNLAVPEEEFSYGRSKIFIRNPRTVSSVGLFKLSSLCL